MSSKSSTTSTGLRRRSAAALGASAVLSLALAGPVLAQASKPLPSPPPSPASDCRYMGGGSIGQCRDASLFPQGGAGSSTTAERGISDPVAPAAPAPAAPAPRKLVVPLSQPTNVPVIGIGAAAAAVVAGMALIAVNRRRPAGPA